MHGRMLEDHWVEKKTGSEAQVWMGNTKERDGLVLCFHRFCPASGLGFSSGRMNMNGPHLSCHQRLGDLDTYVAFLPIEDRRCAMQFMEKVGCTPTTNSQNQQVSESLAPRIC